MDERSSIGPIQCGRVEQRRHLSRVLVIGQQAAQDQRQRHHANGVSIRAGVGSRQAGRRRHADPEVVPQALATEIQLVERGAKRVLRDSEACQFNRL